MRADFYREDDPETVVGSARWNGRSIDISSDDADVRGTLTRLFRQTPVVVDDPSLRPVSTLGEVVVQPGSLEWFRQVAIARTPATDLHVRLVPEVTMRTGWDPASAYRTFRQVVTRMESPATSVPEPEPEIAKPL